MLKYVVETVNEIDTRIWAVVIVSLGIGACLVKQNQAGLMLIGGGLTAFQQKPPQTP